MDAETLEADLEAEYETELSRLGSSKAIYAATEGEMDADRVEAAVADRLGTAAETVAGWAEREADTGAAAAFGAIADALGDLAEPAAPADPGGMPAAFEDLETTPERAGGLLAWTLVTDRTLSQAVGFFVGNADPRAANRYREVRSTVEDHRDRAADLLDAVCADPAEWEAAAAAAGAVIEAAYDRYVATLEGLGVKVKPVC